MCKQNLQMTVHGYALGSECYNTSGSPNYLGRRMCTVSGRFCQRWDAQTPHAHSFTQDADFPGEGVAASDAYCRFDWESLYLS